VCIIQSIVGHILQLMQHSWASEGPGLFASIALDYCIIEIMGTSKDMCVDMWQTTSIGDVMLQQIQSVSAQSMADISSEICVTCLCFFEQLLEYNLLEIIAHNKNHGFIKHCVTLLPSSECGNHVMTFLAKCTKYSDLLPTLVSLGVIDGFFAVFSKFKQTVNTLSEVLGAFVGPVYSVTVVKTLAQHMTELLAENVAANAKIFNGDHIDIISRLHGTVCEELRKGQLKFSDELTEMCDALYELLEAIVAAHVATNSRLAAMMTHECSQITAKWNKDLNAAYTAGTFTTNTDMETEMEGTDAPAPLYSSHVAQRTDIEVIGVPHWETGAGSKVLRATVPRNVTIDMLRGGFSSMCQRAVTVNFQNDNRTIQPLEHPKDLQVLIERASAVRTMRPAVTIYLKLDNSSSFTSNTFRSQPNPITSGKKESVLADLKRQGIQIGKKVNSELMSAFYDYFRDQNVSEINQEQFVSALTSDKLGYDEQFAADIFNGFDDDGNGTLSLTEIAIGFAKLMNGSTHDKLTLMFQAYDADRNNALDVDELTNMIMVSAGLPYEEAHQYAHDVGSKVDDNNDGWLDFEEFEKAVYLGLIPLGLSFAAHNTSTHHQITTHHSTPTARTQFIPPAGSTRSPARTMPIHQRAHTVGDYEDAVPALSRGSNGPDQRSRTVDDYDLPPPASVPTLSRGSGGGKETAPALVRGGGDPGIPALSRSTHSADDASNGRKRAGEGDAHYESNASTGQSSAKAAVRQSIAERKVNPFGNKKK
jgi:Ca2+-binding EF-hand superfamily protein